VGGGERRQSATGLIKCPVPETQAPSGTVFNLTESGELFSEFAHACLSTAPMNGVELWSKPLSGGKVAALLLNVLSMPQSLSLPLRDVPGLEGADRCSIRDLWGHRDAFAHAGRLDVTLKAHASALYVFSCTHGFAAQLV